MRVNIPWNAKHGSNSVDFERIWNRNYRVQIEIPINAEVISNRNADLFQ